MIRRAASTLVLALLLGPGALPAAAQSRAGPPAAAQKPKLNVLFIISDDLRKESTPERQRLVRTPNIDRLAGWGTRFSQAHAQYPLCNPSRVSLLTGRYPTTTRVMGNEEWFRAIDPDVVTLPQHFRANGYVTLRTGKIFHGGMDDEISWTHGGEPRGFTGERRPPPAPAAPDGLTRAQRSDRIIVLEGDGEEDGDYRSATRAIEYLEEYGDSTFFLAVGFSKPHSPPAAPEKHFDLYDLGGIPLPPDFDTSPEAPPGFPEASVRRRNADLFIGRDASPDQAREMIRAYHASTTYMDAQVGRVLDALERLGLRESTIVVFFGDHGYHLGEKGKWSKAYSLYEVGLHVPLVIAAPGIEAQVVTRPVELVDLFPTLIELAGLPAVAGLEGHSLAPLLRGPAAGWDHPALAQTLFEGKLGRSVRTDRWHYAEWDGGAAGAMLFDLASDPRELRNLADDPAHAAKVREMKAALEPFPATWRTDAPATATAAATVGLAPGRTSEPDPATVVIDAADFLAEIQKDHVMRDAATLGVPWIFNNTALEMRTRSNYVLRATVPRAGRYHLYARSIGRPGAFFRVAVGDRVIDHDLGDEPLRFERAGAFQLEAGPVDVRLMRIEGSPVLDVLVLSTDSTLTEEDLVPLQLDPDVRLIRRYQTPPSGVVKFGDLTGDGKIDFLVVTDDYSAHAFDHEGRPLWSYESEEKSEKDEPPGVIWDVDRDGDGEAIHWRYLDGREWLVVADGRSGEVLRKAPWPTKPLPHPFNNYRLVVAKLEPGYPGALVTFTDTGGWISVAAFDTDLHPLWNHVEEKKKDHLGHYPYAVDLDGDGIDEIAVSALVLDARGQERWNRFDFFYDNHDHVDSYRFADLDGDGQVEMVTAHSEVGTVAYDSRTGAIVWQNMAEHAQQVEVGDFLDGVPGPHVAIGARTYGNTRAGEEYLWSQVWWFDRGGRLLSKWPGKPLNGNPEIIKGDWAGDGTIELFWYKFRMRRDGTGEIYFADPIYHMFDFVGDAAEEVITRQGGVMSVYGSRRADAGGERVERGREYLRRRIVNHTHY